MIYHHTLEKVVNKEVDWLLPKIQKLYGKYEKIVIGEAYTDQALLLFNLFFVILANYSSWGANKHKVIIAEDSSIGLQFTVSGLLFKGIVRVWYNYGSDYFDIELIKGQKSVKEFEDIDFESLHNLIHRNIEERC